MKRVVILAACAVAAYGQPLDFRRDVAPILRTNCLPCHNAQRNYAGLRIDTPALARKAIVPGNPDQSKLYSKVLAARLRHLGRLITNDPQQSVFAAGGKTSTTTSSSW